MKATVRPFPYGHAEGFPVLHVDCEGEPFRGDLASALIRQESRPGHLFAWLDGLETWDEPVLVDWLMSSSQTHDLPLSIVGLRRLGADRWPPVGCSWVMDVSEALAKPTLRELADHISSLAHSHPRVGDLVAHAPLTHPLSSTALDMLAEAVNPDGLCYLYAGDQDCGALRRVVAQANTPWSLRSV